MSNAHSALEEHPLHQKKQRPFWTKVRSSLYERQKHIRIAERSNNGWATVEEYVEDELADN